MDFDPLGQIPILGTSTPYDSSDFLLELCTI